MLLSINKIWQDKQQRQIVSTDQSPNSFPLSHRNVKRAASPSFSTRTMLPTESLSTSLNNRSCARPAFLVGQATSSRNKTQATTWWTSLRKTSSRDRWHRSNVRRVGWATLSRTMKSNLTCLKIWRRKRRRDRITIHCPTSVVIFLKASK